MSSRDKQTMTLARTWLRRIALGLPLIAAPSLTGCASCEGPCNLPPDEVRVRITAEQRDMLAEGGASAAACADLCATEVPAQDAGTHNSFRLLGCSADDADGGVELTCAYRMICIGGRRPSGLVDPRAPRSASPVGEWLARSAHLEAASVPAFLELARELALHGGPRALIEGARRAARDEVDHARAIAGLARRHGVAPAHVERAVAEPRTLAAIAEDNAIEGCTREAFAALIAAEQAGRARDPEVARTYARIAVDEARHALWSLALHDWASERLGARGARAIEARRREALEELARDVEDESAPMLREVLGLPGAERAVALSSALA